MVIGIETYRLLRGEWPHGSKAEGLLNGLLGRKRTFAVATNADLLDERAQSSPRSYFQALGENAVANINARAPLSVMGGKRTSNTSMATVW